MSSILFQSVITAYSLIGNLGKFIRRFWGHILFFVGCFVFGGFVGTIIYKSSASEDDPKVIDKQLTAIMRDALVETACYDKKLKKHFLLVAQHEPDEKLLDQGWYLFSDIKFLEQQTGEFIQISQGTYLKVRPNIDGLQCKSQNLSKENT